MIRDGSVGDPTEHRAGDDRLAVHLGRGSGEAQEALPGAETSRLTRTEY
jgi:hypothetical protein